MLKLDAIFKTERERWYKVPENWIRNQTEYRINQFGQLKSNYGLLKPIGKLHNYSIHFEGDQCRTSISAGRLLYAVANNVHPKNIDGYIFVKVDKDQVRGFRVGDHISMIVVKSQSNCIKAAKYVSGADFSNQQGRKLKTGQVKQIRQWYGNVSVSRLAEKFKVSEQTIREVAKGRRYKDI